MSRTDAQPPSAADTPATAGGSILNRLLFFSLLAIVALVPLPLASNRPLPAALVALILGLILIVWAVSAVMRNEPGAVSVRRVAWPLGLAALTVSWIIVQWSPWTPDSWHHPVWQQASGILGEQLAGRITVNPDATLAALMRLLSYAAVFWLAMQLAVHRKAARQAVLAVILAGTAYALYGLVIFFSGNETILTFEKWAYLGSLTSTFVNRNSYATYAGLGLMAASALLIDRLRPVLRMPGPPRRRAAEVMERLLGQDAALCAAIVVLASALILTMSRAGAVCSVAGMLLMLSLMLPSKRGGRGYLIIGALVVMVLVIFAVSGDPLLERYLRRDAVLTENARWQVYRLVLAAIADAPLLGTGYGTFPNVFTGYIDTYIWTVGFWDKAHNTYLENMLELGVPAALSLYAAIGMLAWSTLRGAHIRRRGRLYPALAAGASLTVALHSLVDFSLQIPAVAVTYAFILGVGVAQSSPSFVDERRSG